MKRTAAALLLASAGIAAQAATVGWTFWGLTEHSQYGSDVLIPFEAYLQVDTGLILKGNGPDGPGSSEGGSRFDWKVTDNSGLPMSGGYSCGGGGPLTIERYLLSDNEFTMTVVDRSGDCGIFFRVMGLGIGTQRYEVDGDPLTRWYDLNRSGVTFEVGMAGNLAYSAISVSSGKQMIPEPASLALFGAGLAALVGFGARRRRGA